LLQLHEGAHMAQLMLDITVNSVWNGARGGGGGVLVSQRCRDFFVTMMWSHCYNARSCPSTSHGLTLLQLEDYHGNCNSEHREQQRRGVA
jgi:hypothetical protein